MIASYLAMGIVAVGLGTLIYKDRANVIKPTWDEIKEWNDEQWLTDLHNQDRDQRTKTPAAQANETTGDETQRAS